LKDGETNLLAGLFRRDRSRADTQIPFLSELPIIGRLVTNTHREDTTTDIVLTLTPHIIRIPDITEEDITPVYVGTDQNISYQGAPRVESSAGSGPFDIQRRQPPGVPPQPAQSAPPAINLAPGSGPTDPFAKPVPQPTPQPQGAALTSSSSPVTVASASVVPVFDLDPPSASFKTGDTMTVSVRATGDSLPPSALAVRYDPSVVAVVGVEPVLEDSSAAETRIEPGRVVLDLPGGTVLAGTKAVAHITMKAIAPGKSVLSFEQAPGGASSATLEVTK
jgi:general secretion pathway protein D